MSDLLSVFSQFFDTHANCGDSFNVAYSGGLDSTVLLHLANDFFRGKSQVKAIHINHHISEDADAWSEHCATYCTKLNVPFTIIDVDVSPFLHKGVEAAARQARYDALVSSADNNANVLLGQHLDDQAETFLLQLVRGAGPQGLSAMPAHKIVNSVDFYRPLLTCSRAQIQEYANKHDLHWIEDDSNSSLKFDRNFIRHKIIPQLQERFPSINRQISKSALLCANESMVLKEYMDSLANKITNQNTSISIDQLQSLAIHTQASFIRNWLHQCGVSVPSSVLLTNVLKIISSKNEHPTQVAIGEHIVYRYRNLLQLRHNNDTLAAFSYTFRAGAVKFDTGEFQIIGQIINGAIVKTSNTILVPSESIVSVERGGVLSQKFKPFANRPTKMLKNWCKEWGISPLDRQNIVTFSVNERLIAVMIDEVVLDTDFLNTFEEATQHVSLTYTAKDV